MSSSPAGGLCLPAGKHLGILTFFKHKSKKNGQKRTFFGSPEFFDLSRVLVCFSWWDIEELGVLFDYF